MTLRLQNMMLAMLLALTTLFVGLVTMSQNPASGGYQLFGPVALEHQHAIQLASLENFDYFARIAPECYNAPNRVATQIAPKIERQMGRRGWDRTSIDETIARPQRTVTTRDTRHNPETGVRNDDPATAHINGDGSYVVRNDRTGDIVQVSDRTDPNWKTPFE